MAKSGINMENPYSCIYDWSLAVWKDEMGRSVMEIWHPAELVGALRDMRTDGQSQSYS